jgi:serine protease Do
MLYRILLGVTLLTWVGVAQPEETSFERPGENWSWGSGSDESGGGSSYLGVDIADVSSERLSTLKLKEEQGAEVTMVDQDAPAGKAGLHEHDVILTMNGTAVESAAQLRRMIRETPAGRVVALGISRDGQPLTLKVQLADRRKTSKSFVNPQDFKFEMPAMPVIADLDIPVSIVIAHSSMRSGLMVENITPQLGDFFGVKNGNGVLVRSVDKGSRAEKAGFRAGDVVVKVNAQPIHDTSDFTHALRSLSGASAPVTVIRDRKEQSLTLTLPAKKDSGLLMEDSFDIPEVTAETQMELTRVENELARVTPLIEKEAERQASKWKQEQENFQKKLEESQEKMRTSQRKMQERQQKMEREISGEWTEI